VSFLVIPTSTSLAQANPGAIWTTNGSCGSEQQDVNHFNHGDVVYINGSGFGSGESIAWTIDGQPGNASCDPNITVASGNLTSSADGNFCINAYTVAADDCGEYQVKAGNKGDNYRVPDSTTLTPTPTPTSAVTATPTPTSAVTATPTPTSAVTATPTPTTVQSSNIKKTFMCYDTVQGSYWRIRNDGGATSGTITWKINQSSLTDIGQLASGEARFFYTEVCGVLTVYENGVSKGTATCNTRTLCEQKPTPTPTTPVEEPTATPVPDPTATPKPQEPTSTPGPVSTRWSALGYNATCENSDIEVTFDTKREDGTFEEKVKVTFEYQGTKKTAETNNNGRATVMYGKNGDGAVTAVADGYPSQSTHMIMPVCPAVGGQVLGVTTGQVLGATTYAATGNDAQSIFTAAQLLGMLLIATGTARYVKASLKA